MPRPPWVAKARRSRRRLLLSKKCTLDEGPFKANALVAEAFEGLPLLA
jgi:hypothetical protein